VIVGDNEPHSMACPADYTVTADGVNQGATVDLTNDLANVAAVDNCGIDVGDIWISDPTPVKPAVLPVGSNVITVSGVDVNDNPESCTYVVTVLAVGACCGAPNVGCIDGVVLADCPEGGFWQADTKCSEDCGNIYELLLRWRNVLTTLL
jgi:hypothetical protein